MYKYRSIVCAQCAVNFIGYIINHLNDTPLFTCIEQTNMIIIEQYKVPQSETSPLLFSKQTASSSLTTINATNHFYCLLPPFLFSTIFMGKMQQRKVISYQ